MAEGVKYYLAEWMPFFVQVSVAGGIEGYQATGSSAPIVREMPRFGGGKIRCIAGDTSGAVAEELNNRLRLAMQNRPLKWSVDVCCHRSKSSWQGKAQTEFRLTFDWGSDIQEFLGESAFLQAEIFAKGYPGLAEASSFQFNTSEMPITAVQEEGRLVFVDFIHNPVINGLLPPKLYWERQLIAGNMNLLVIDRTYRGPCLPKTMAVFQRMLENEIFSDVSIVASNGAEVRCHSNILAAHSNVFQAMFSSKMQEAKTRRIEMPDISEDAVRALLAYLYHWDQSRAEKSCAVALELLKAGHKYHICPLEKSMERLLVSKPASWYQVDVIDDLYQFVRLFSADCNLLKKKVVMLMTKRIPDFKKGVAVMELFRENPVTAIALLSNTPI